MLKIDYKFKDESLLRLAMTHSSYANEHHGTHLQCNERLEFLGDSVLGFVTAGYLFTHYPDLPEGDLTKLRAAVVCEGALDEIAHEIGIPEAIRLGHGEEMGGGRKRASILADATEALLGAIFMDGGIEPARAFVLRFIPHKVEVALAGGAFTMLGVRIPSVLEAPIRQLSALTTPLALFVLGGTLQFSSIREHLSCLTATLVCKLLVFPAVTLWLSGLLGLQPVERFLLLSVFATPVATASYPMAEAMDGDGKLAAEFVAISTVTSVVTLFFWLTFFARYL